MRRLSILPIAVSLAATWFTHPTATAAEPAATSSAAAAKALYDNVITHDDLNELFSLYLIERGLAPEDSRRIADSARQAIEKCGSPDQGCFVIALQEHGLIDAMQWIGAKVHSRQEVVLRARS
jgi:hypothetical protein